MSKAQFDKAVAIVNSLPPNGPVKPTQEDQLYFYARFKQAKVGDINTTRPTGVLDFANKYKWDAWKGVKGKTAEDAQKEYVDKLIELLKKAGDPESLAHIEAIENA